MTTHTATPGAVRSSDTWPMFAAASTGLALVLTAIGTFWSPLADYDATYDGGDLASYLVVAAFIVAAAAVVFALVVRRSTPEGAPARSLVLAVVGVLSLAVFWTGLPTLLAGGALCLAIPAWAGSRRAKVSVVLAVLVITVAVLAALAG